MNIYEKMSYKDFIFPTNPTVIKISDTRKTVQHKIPFSENIIKDIGKNSRTVSGEGEFYGENCIEDFNRLKRVFENGGGGMLYIPSQKPLYAIFSSLDFIAQDIEGTVKYNFEFIESFENRPNENILFCISDGNMTLWDISYKYNKAIEYLLKINPSVSRPDNKIKKGSKIILC